MPTVSIIIPCYNDGRYLPEAVAAAQAQTWADKEIIIVDDHSTDDMTRQVLRRYADEPGVTVLATPSGRKGPAAARNAGIEAARGTYILALDADDIIDPTYAEKTVTCMECNPKLGICYSRARFCGFKHSSWNLLPYTWEMMLRGEVIFFVSALFRKADWEIVGGYDESLVLGYEDYAFWLRLLALGRDVFRLDEELFYYRVKSNSRSAILVRGKDAEAFDAVYRSCEDIFKKNTKVFIDGVRQLQYERSTIHCLVSWKLFSAVARIEWALRQCIKKIVGRA